MVYYNKTLNLIDHLFFTFKADDEDVVITLVARNPQAPKNKIRFDHTTGAFVEIKLVERIIDHLNINHAIKMSKAV